MKWRERKKDYWACKTATLKFFRCVIGLEKTGFSHCSKRNRSSLLQSGIFEHSSHSTHLTGIAIMYYMVYNITSTQVAPLTPARGSSFLNEFRAAPGSVKQMLGGGGGGEEGRGPSAVLSLFVSCSLSRLFWQANASKLPSILFSADPELLKVKHMCFGLSSRYCTTHLKGFKSILVKDIPQKYK